VIESAARAAIATMATFAVFFMEISFRKVSYMQATDIALEHG
jgi:hypothetical protein